MCGHVAICPVARLFPEGNTLTRRLVRAHRKHCGRPFARINLFFSCGVRFFNSPLQHFSGRRRHPEGLASAAEPQGRISGSKSCNLFFVRSDLPEGEVPQPDGALAGRSGRGFTPALILFIALPETQDNPEPG